MPPEWRGIRMGFFSKVSYDADSRRTTMMLGSGTTRRYQFDERGQLTTQIEFNGGTATALERRDHYAGDL